MNMRMFSIVVRMLNDVNSVSEYIEFVRREIPARISDFEQSHARTLCKIAFAASRTPHYEFVRSRNVTSFRRALASACGTDGSMRMLHNGVVYRIANLRFAVSAASSEDMEMVIEALEMTVSYASSYAMEIYHD